MAAAIDLSSGGRHRCVGALAATTAIGNSGEARERFNVEHCSTVTVRAKGTTITSDPGVQIVGQLPSVKSDSASTGDVASGLTTATTLTTDTEVTHTYTLLGERYVDVVVTCDSGDLVTITSVDVFAQGLT
ncbi:hypothetical protein LCGC14_1829580 [marine sediment metagenome]|uniref:Uncharacterized protein n=1 Tax=marine sediment metagenome TaxID=412755 RepID=A0A0F9IW26_9ZZZZ